MVGWHHDSMDMNLSKLQEMVKTGKPIMLKSMGSTKSWTQQLKVRVWQKHLLCLEMVGNPHSACHVE